VNTIVQLNERFYSYDDGLLRSWIVMTDRDQPTGKWRISDDGEMQVEIKHTRNQSCFFSKTNHRKTWYTEHDFKFLTEINGD
jgi:hypothetical protein